MAFTQNLLTCEAFRVSTQQNVDTTARHVGCNSDRTQAPRLSNNVRLACVLLCVQNLVLYALLIE